MGIADELRRRVAEATKSYDGAPWHAMEGEREEDHTWCHLTEGELLGAADAIEAELAGRYVELPLDADGEPIRVGDVIESDCTMPTEVTHMECFWARDEEPSWTLWWGDARRHGEQDEDWGDFPDDASAYRHARPDTWERVVEDAAQFGHDDDPSHIDMAGFVARCEALAARGEGARDGGPVVQGRFRDALGPTTPPDGVGGPS